jgi:hypothetical protein
MLTQSANSFPVLSYNAEKYNNSSVEILNTKFVYFHSLSYPIKIWAFWNISPCSVIDPYQLEGIIFQKSGSKQIINIQARIKLLHT